MKRLTTYLICILFCAVTYSQKSKQSAIALVDSINIARADKVAEKVLDAVSKELSYLVFSIDDKILFVQKTCKSYMLYTFYEEFNYEAQENEFKEIKSEELKKDKVLDEVFNTAICKKPFIYSETDSLSKKYAHWDSEYIYFVIYRDGVKTCEFNLPMTYKVDMKGKETIPIDQRIFNYLVRQLMSKKEYE